MAYYEDLSVYTYHPLPEDGPNVLNVGWLERRHEFQTGDAPDGFADRLTRLALGFPVNRMRGWQECQFCNEEYPVQVEIDGRREPVGDAEIRVPSLMNPTYAAPTLIAHYVSVHRYRPPAEFFSAVMADQRASSPLT